MSVRSRRIAAGLSTLIVLTSFTPTCVPAATDPRGEGPITVSWPVQRRGDPDMPEGTPHGRVASQDAVRTRDAAAPVVRASFWQALARRFGFALGV
jgi:hypothetical protein